MGARPSGFDGAAEEATELQTFKDWAARQVVSTAKPERVWSAEQQAIFEYFEHGAGHLMVDAVAGCLAGDTIVGINRGGKSFAISLAQLVQKQNSMQEKPNQSRWGGACWDSRIPTRIRAEDATGYVQLFDLTAAVESGVKPTLLVTLQDGRTLRGTADHRIRTVDGWWTLGALRPGSMVFVEQPVVAAWGNKKPYYRGVVINGVKEAEHRLVIEAGWNGLSLLEYIDARRAGLISLRRLGVRQIVHHRNGDTLDNRRSNLLVMGGLAEHSRHHAHLSAWRHVTPFVVPVAVSLIKEYGMEPTYDLTVAVAENFLANGMVVHNSGKTTTIVEGVKRAPEKNPLCVAFNKKIADALNEQLVDSYASAKTLHSLGYGMIRKHWKGMPVAEGSARAEQITDAIIPAEDKAKLPKLIYRLITNLHTKAREICPLTWNEDVLWEVGGKFDLLPDEQGWGKFGPAYVIERAGEALSWTTENEPDRAVGIDYADMVFLPLVWDLAARDYDMVVVDERQDMTQAQLELALRSCNGRIVLVGDRHQAIYGFRGADSANGEAVAKQLGAVSLPLTTSYRCDRAIIADAQRLVPHIQARTGAGEGIVDGAGYEDCLNTVRPGEFILSRLNAPLVSTTLALLRGGTRARMAGRDIGQGILKLLRRLKVESYTPLSQVSTRVDDWEAKERQRFAARGLLNEVTRIIDTAGMLQAFVDDSDSTPAMIERITSLFTDEEGPFVLLSSVHKAKGLEADRVWLLQESFYRFGDGDEEMHIHYVAITRAKHHLTYVTGVPSLARQEWQKDGAVS